MNSSYGPRSLFIHPSTHPFLRNTFCTLSTTLDIVFAHNGDNYRTQALNYHNKREMLSSSWPKHISPLIWCEWETHLVIGPFFLSHPPPPPPSLSFLLLLSCKTYNRLCGYSAGTDVTLYYYCGSGTWMVNWLEESRTKGQPTNPSFQTDRRRLLGWWHPSHPERKLSTCRQLMSNTYFRYRRLW